MRWSINGQSSSHASGPGTLCRTVIPARPGGVADWRGMVKTDTGMAAHFLLPLSL